MCDENGSGLPEAVEVAVLIGTQGLFAVSQYKLSLGLIGVGENSLVTAEVGLQIDPGDQVGLSHGMGYLANLDSDLVAVYFHNRHMLLTGSVGGVGYQRCV